MNTIDNFSNLSFNGRYLKINKNVPECVSNAIYKNDNIEYFIFKKPKQKSLLSRILDMFKKDEVLEVDYQRGDYLYKATVDEETGIFNGFGDPYSRMDTLTFNFHKAGNKQDSLSTSSITESQKGIRRIEGVVAKRGEHLGYMFPTETAEEKIAKRVENIDNIEQLLNM